VSTIVQKWTLIPRSTNARKRLTKDLGDEAEPGQVVGPLPGDVSAAVYFCGSFFWLLMDPVTPIERAETR
jgi:hypothetical protein